MSLAGLLRRFQRVPKQRNGHVTVYVRDSGAFYINQEDLFKSKIFRETLEKLDGFPLATAARKAPPEIPASDSK